MGVPAVRFVAPNNIVPGDLSGLESEGLVIDDCLLPGFLLGPLTRITHVDYLAASLHERHELTQARAPLRAQDAHMRIHSYHARTRASRKPPPLRPLPPHGDTCLACTVQSVTSTYERPSASRLQQCTHVHL